MARKSVQISHSEMVQTGTTDFGPGVESSSVSCAKGKQGFPEPYYTVLCLIGTILTYKPYLYDSFTSAAPH